LTNLNRSHNIYVPDHLVAAYQGISWWTANQGHILPLSTLST
jgi:hypothetical protein